MPRIQRLSSYQLKWMEPESDVELQAPRRAIERLRWCCSISVLLEATPPAVETAVVTAAGEVVKNCPSIEKGRTTQKGM
jgi:hypothetical protein